MAKTKTFYAVLIHNDEKSGEIKAYCKTKEIAERELKKYCDFYYQSKRHIIKLEMIVE